MEVDSDLEDNKVGVRSSIDALMAEADKAQTVKRKRGRPSKNPSMSETPEPDKVQTVDRKRGRPPKKSMSETPEPDLLLNLPDENEAEDSESDGEWTLESEDSPSKKRNRKRPSFFSVESAQETINKRSAQKPRGRPRASFGSHASTSNSRESLLAKAESALQTLLSSIVKGQSEKALVRILPKPDEPLPNLAERTFMKSIEKLDSFRSVRLSGGFRRFISAWADKSIVTLYNAYKTIFKFPGPTEELEIAQAVRHVWNTLPFSTRRQWEKAARKECRSVERLDTEEWSHANAISMPPQEVPINVDEERLLEEKEVEKKLKAGLRVEDTDCSISCPLCEVDEHAEGIDMDTIEEMQEHFFDAHWQVHTYGCHLCGMLYPTAEDLVRSHRCEDWLQWVASRMLQGDTNMALRLEMTRALLFLTCAECGLHLALPYLRQKGEKIEKNKIKMIKTVLAHHNNNSLLTFVVYFPEELSPQVDSLHFEIIPKAMGGPTLSCSSCPSVSFTDSTEAEAHFQKEHPEQSQQCRQCSQKWATDTFRKWHALTHVSHYSALADYLSYRARVFPPGPNRCSAPRVGWHKGPKGIRAVGGLSGGIGEHYSDDYVEPLEDCVEQKLRNDRRRREREESERTKTGDIKKDPESDVYSGNQAQLKPAEGFENVTIRVETPMAAHVRKMLMEKFGKVEGIEGLKENDSWLTNNQAEQFREWITYWEKQGGKKKNGGGKGPPSGSVVEVNADSIYRVPVLPVYIPNTPLAVTDFMAGFILNESVYYCHACDRILKGRRQAEEHLTKETKCAQSESGEICIDPDFNHNVSVLFSSDSFPRDSRLPCPHCDESACSITGLKQHILTRHGVLALGEAKKGESLIDASTTSSLSSLRSALTGAIDNALGMPEYYKGRLQLHITPALDNTVARELIVTPPDCLPDWFVRAGGGGRPTLPAQLRPSTPPQSYGQNGTRPMHSNMAQKIQSALQARYPVQTVQNPRPYMKNGFGSGHGMGGQYHHQQQHMQQGQMPPMMPPTAEQRPSKIVALIKTATKFHWNCLLCGDQMLFTNQEQFQEHVLRDHMYSCGYCSQIYSSYANLRYHHKWCRGATGSHSFRDPRSPTTRATCTACGCRMPLSSFPGHLVAEHIDKVTVMLPYGKVTPTCDAIQSVDTPQTMRADEYRSMARTPMSVACVLCDMRFSNRTSLRQHMMSHPEKFRFCGVCNRNRCKYAQNAVSLVEHLKEAHTRVLPASAAAPHMRHVSCTACHRNLGHRAVAHLLYECIATNHCNLCVDLPEFVSVKDLGEHRLQCHANILKRFQCSDCRHHFYTVTDFENHMCTGQEDQIACACGEIVGNRAQFNQHYKERHVSGMFCQLCGNPFATERALNIHRDKYVNVLPQKRAMLICDEGIMQESEMDKQQLRLQSSALVEQQETGMRMGRPSVARPPASSSPEENDEEKEPEDDADDETSIKYVVHTLIGTVVETVFPEEAAAERSAKKARRAPPPALSSYVEVDDSDNDCMIVDEDSNGSTPNGTTGVLQARVREETGDDHAGGEGLPGYREEEDDDVTTPLGESVMKEFAPGEEGDDELCVVAEAMDKPCSATAAASLSRQREKAHKCPQCSDRFMTKGSMEHHIQESHSRGDAGMTTCIEELGIPLGVILWVCRSCCIAYSDWNRFIMHKKQHQGNQIIACQTCSAVAYNKQVLSMHQQRISENKLGYICSKCMCEFKHEINLFEHMASEHQQILFYFCKSCDFGSTDGHIMYKHYKEECNNAMAGRHSNVDKPADLLGVCLAQQLHFQPNSVDEYKRDLAEGKITVLQPSVCNHRSMLVATDKLITCPDCNCLMNILTFKSEMVYRMNWREDHIVMTRQQKTVRAPFHDLSQKYQLAMHSRSRYKAPMTAAQLRMAQFQGMPSLRSSMPSPVVVTQKAGGYAPPIGPTIPNASNRNKNPRMVQTTSTPQQFFPSSSGQLPARMMNARISALNRRHPNGSASPQQQPHNLAEALSSIVNAELGARVAVREGAPIRMEDDDDCMVVEPSPSSSSPASRQSPVDSFMMRSRDRAQRLGTSSSNARPDSPLFSSSSIVTSSPMPFPGLHSNGHKFACGECKISLGDEQAAVAHWMERHTVDHTIHWELSCPIHELVECSSLKLKSLVELRTHLNTVHKQALPHRAENCTARFCSESAMEEHDALHQKSVEETGVEHQCCILCGSLDTWSKKVMGRGGVTTVRSHTLMHSMCRRTMCRECHVTFSKDVDCWKIMTHFIFTHTTGEGQDRMCKLCRLPFEADDALKKHVMEKHLVYSLHPRTRDTALTIRTTSQTRQFLGLKTIYSNDDSSDID